MTVREMRPDDAESVALLERQCFSQPWSANSFRDALANENTLYLVALDEGKATFATVELASAEGAAGGERGKIVGCCGLWQSFEEGEITNVAVDEAYRRRGVAARMLTELFGKASHRGVTAFTLEVRQGNTPAVKLYENLGFVTAGIRKNFYQKPTENALVMWKR